MALSLLCRQLATFLKSGISLPTALKLATTSCEHSLLANSLNRLRLSLESDEEQRIIRAESGSLPMLVRQALWASPELRVELLDELARVYSLRLRQRSDWAANLAPPMTVVCIGVLVGFTIVALLLPLVSMVSSLA